MRGRDNPSALENLHLDPTPFGGGTAAAGVL